VKLLRSIWDEIIGLFVDDGALALLCVALITLAVVMTLFLAVPPLYTSFLLLAGCVAILGWTVWRALRGTR
jgi:hypothetical protein